VGTRCVLDVASVAPYPKYQKRLSDSLDRVGYVGDRLFWTNEMPPGSPPQRDCPYCFKVYAFEEAIRRGHTTLLWLDTSVFMLRSPDPLFEKIEADGHFLIIGGDRLGNWSSDMALERFGVGRDAAMEMQLIGGTVIGLDVSNPRTLEWFTQWSWHAKNGTFAGTYYNGSGNARRSGPGKSIGVVSRDPRVYGSRADETVGSLLAYKLGMELTWIGGTGGHWFQSDESIARSNYEL
jgi:hypothetical protein